MARSCQIDMDLILSKHAPTTSSYVECETHEIRNDFLGLRRLPSTLAFFDSKNKQLPKSNLVKYTTTVYNLFIIMIKDFQGILGDNLPINTHVI